MLNYLNRHGFLSYPHINEADIGEIDLVVHISAKQIKKLKQIKQEKIMGNIIFTEESADIKALRAIKPLAIEIQEKEDMGFASALNKAAIELGFKNYSSYKKDTIINN